MRQIKVLEILEATVGGTRRHLVSIVREIDKTQFHVEVAAPTIRETTIADTTFVAEIEATGVPFHAVEMHRSVHPIQDIKSLITLIKLIRNGKYDLVHTHSSKAGFLGRLAAKINRIPAIYTPNGFYFLDGANSQVKNWVYQFLERFAGLITARLIAVSASEGKTAVSHKIVPPANLVTIPNAIYTKDFMPDLDVARKMRMQLDIEPETPIVGTIARYIPQKDPLTFIRAAKIVLEQCPQTRFVWCGEGEMRHETESLARQLDISHAFHFLGFREDIADIMKMFDIFALSSIFEGLPYTLLEVMSTAVPVVATDVVGSRDIVVANKTGRLVPPANPLQFAQAVINLIQNRDLRTTMGAAGREIVINKYDIKSMVKQIEAVYQTILCAK